MRTSCCFCLPCFRASRTEGFNFIIYGDGRRTHFLSRHCSTVLDCVRETWDFPLGSRIVLWKFWFVVYGFPGKVFWYNGLWVYVISGKMSVKALNVSLFSGPAYEISWRLHKPIARCSGMEDVLWVSLVFAILLYTLSHPLVCPMWVYILGYALSYNHSLKFGFRRQKGVLPAFARLYLGTCEISKDCLSSCSPVLIFVIIIVIKECQAYVQSL